MGGERASKTRQREAGKICALCNGMIVDPPQYHGERVCGPCEAARGRRRIYMHFQKVNGKWKLQFLEADLETRLPRIVRFNTSQELIGFALRGGADSSPWEAMRMKEVCARGRGSVWLSLDQKQYESLRRR